MLTIIRISVILDSLGEASAILPLLWESEVSIMKDNFNKLLGEKLKKVRESLDLSMKYVSEKMNFNNDNQTLAEIESGRRTLKAGELVEFAKIYFKDISYFLSIDMEENGIIKPPLVIWRNCSDDPQVKLKEQEFLKYCRNYYDLEKRLALEHFYSIPQMKLTPDDFDYKMVAEFAKQYYSFLNLGSRPACLLAKVLEEKCNIKILFLDLGKTGSAASTVGEFGAAILVNSSDPSWRRNFDIAHEFFHIITWDLFKHEQVHYVQGAEKPFIEKFADFFAACLLLPSEEVLSEFDLKLKSNSVDFLDLVGMAKEFQVSTEALLWRLVSLRRLKKEIVKELLEKEGIKKSLEERFKEETHIPHLSDRYVNLAFKAYKNQLISRGKLAEYLDINRAEVSAKLQKYGYNEEEIYDEKLSAA